MNANLRTVALSALCIIMIQNVSAQTILAGVKSNDKWGFINQSGEWVIQPQFDNVESFAEGFAGAKTGKDWGYIDQTGTWVIRPEYKRAEDFAEGLARVIMRLEDDNKWVFIGKDGKQVFLQQFF